MVGNKIIVSYAPLCDNTNTAKVYLPKNETWYKREKKSVNTEYFVLDKVTPPESGIVTVTDPR